MPSKLDKIPLASPFLDRRTKMLPCQKERCYAMHHSEGMGIRELSRVFKVDKRMIQFICYPERMQENKRKREERGGSAQYYDTSKNTAAMREHRAHKREVKTKIHNP